MSIEAGDPPVEAQEAAEDLEAVADGLHTQHYSTETSVRHSVSAVYSPCSWCLKPRPLQTVQRHQYFGDGWGELYLCGRCTVLWRLWATLSEAPVGLEEYILASVQQYTTFWRGLISAFWAVVPRRA